VGNAVWVFIAIFIRSSAVQKFENWLRFDEVIVKVRQHSFLRHSVQLGYFNCGDDFFLFLVYKVMLVAALCFYLNYTKTLH